MCALCFPALRYVCPPGLIRSLRFFFCRAEVVGPGVTSPAILFPRELLFQRRTLRMRLSGFSLAATLYSSSARARASLKLPAICNCRRPPRERFLRSRSPRAFPSTVGKACTSHSGNCSLLFQLPRGGEVLEDPETYFILRRNLWNMPLHSFLRGYLKFHIPAGDC